MIIGCIEAAEGWVETYTSHVLVQRDYTLIGNGCRDGQDVYLFPVESIPVGVKFYRNALCSTFWVKHDDSITFKVGYTTYDEIPKQLIAAVKKLIVYLYENRDAYAIDDNTDVKMLVNQLRRGIVVV